MSLEQFNKQLDDKKTHSDGKSEGPKNSTCLPVLTSGARFVIVHSHEKNLKIKGQKNL